MAEDLPREVITHLPPHSSCPDCGGALRQFGQDVSEQLERIPAAYKVICHVRPKFACAHVVAPAAAARPIERGLPAPALLAHVLVSKYADRLPLYRQFQIYACEGVELDRSTLAGWVGASSELLAPLVEKIRKHVLAASKIYADDRGPRGQVFVRGWSTHRVRYLLQATARRRLAGYGLMRATTGPQA